ncbi:MAG: hypothetical protein Q4B90_10345 [Eubacteriales bacterium]|nr:hypothetical protein [Eubacteriales bacterium]
MKKKRYLTAAVLLMSCAMGTTVYAGDINENEANVIAAASVVFTYEGRRYVATQEAMGILYNKLCEDGIDLTAEQAEEAISLGYANVGVGVQMEYLMPIDPPETEPPQEETVPGESETTPVESETLAPHDTGKNPESPQRPEYGEESNPESGSKEETENYPETETDRTGKQGFVDRLIKRLKREKNPDREEKVKTADKTVPIAEGKKEIKEDEITAQSQEQKTEDKENETAKEQSADDKTAEETNRSGTEEKRTEETEKPSAGIEETDDSQEAEMENGEADGDQNTGMENSEADGDQNTGIKTDETDDGQSAENKGAEKQNAENAVVQKEERQDKEDDAMMQKPEEGMEETPTAEKDESPQSAQTDSSVKNGQADQSNQKHRNKEASQKELTEKTISETEEALFDDTKEEQSKMLLFAAVGAAALAAAALLILMIQKKKDEKGRILCKEKRLIDIHCHILPGIDDGSKNMEETMEMIKIAEKSGVSAIISTVHYKSGMGQENEEIKTIFEKVKKEAEQHFPNLQLYLGNEIYYTEETAEDLAEGKALTLAQSRYVLIEFVPSVMYSEILNAVRKLKMAGYFPILAHIERYECLLDKKGAEHLEGLKKAGAYFQVNGRTFERKHTRKWCGRCLKNYGIDFIASDGHNMGYRTPKMSFAAGWVTRKFGCQTAEDIFVKNPKKILEGEKIK